MLRLLRLLRLIGLAEACYEVMRVSRVPRVSLYDRPCPLGLLLSYCITSYNVLFARMCPAAELTMFFQRNRPPEIREPQTGQVSDARFSRFNVVNSTSKARAGCMTYDCMTADSERIGGYHTLTLLTLLALQALLAVTKPGRENVYSAITSLEAETLTNHLLDAESRSRIAAKMQKEAEMVFSSISPRVSEAAIGHSIFWSFYDENAKRAPYGAY